MGVKQGRERPDYQGGLGAPERETERKNQE